MYWKQTPRVKIYEALGAVADGRVEVSGDSAKVYSSSRNKFYTVQYDPETEAIMVNDNASYYKGYLGYPAIAYLMQVGKIPYAARAATLLQGIPWKDINQKFKNDFEKAAESILAERSESERQEIERAVDAIYAEVSSKKYSLLGEKTAPPSGY